MSVRMVAGVEGRECGDGSRAGLVVGGGRSECEAGGAREVVWEKGVAG